MQIEKGNVVKPFVASRAQKDLTRSHELKKEPCCTNLLSCLHLCTESSLIAQMRG